MVERACPLRPARRVPRRRCSLALLALSAALALGLAYGAPARAASPPVTRTHLKVGQKAPNFKLLSDKWRPTDLSSELGKHNVLLAFYVLAFTPG